VLANGVSQVHLEGPDVYKWVRPAGMTPQVCAKKAGVAGHCWLPAAIRAVMAACLSGRPSAMIARGWLENDSYQLGVGNHLRSHILSAMPTVLQPVLMYHAHAVGRKKERNIVYRR
jgi:hypothetical protein